MKLFENSDMLIAQTNDKLSSFANPAVYVQTSPMALGDNIIRQTQPQASALSRRLGSKKGLENFFFDGFRNAVAIVLDF